MIRRLLSTTVEVILAGLIAAGCSGPATPASAPVPVSTRTLPGPTTGPSPLPTRTQILATPAGAMTPSPVPAGTISVEIFAHREWQSADMIVQHGQSITIQASGEWKHSEAAAFHGPDGIEQIDNSSVLPSAPVGSLIGRIESGDPFKIEERTTLVAGGAGRLYLSMNDHTGMFGDNQGSLMVQLGLNTCGVGWSRLSTGAYAVVAGESGDPPNRVRAEPNTDAEVLTQLYPGSIVRVSEGPICVDDLVFWKVESEAIPGGAGWTAEGNGSDYYMEPYPPLLADSTATQLMIAGGTYFDRGVGVTGTGFVFRPALTDGRAIDHITIQGPPGWNANEVFELYPYQPPHTAEDRALGWVFAEAISGTYTATAETNSGEPVSTTFVIDTASQLAAPVILSVSGSTSQVSVDWSGTSEMRSFLLRLEKEPYATDRSVITETIVGGEQRSLTFSGMSLTAGVEHRVVLFAVSNDIYTPGAVASPANISADVSQTFTP